MQAQPLLNADTNIPSFIKYKVESLYDQWFYKYISILTDDFIIAFDNAYINHKQFEAVTPRNIFI